MKTLSLLCALFCTSVTTASATDSSNGFTVPDRLADKHVFVCEMDGDISHAVLMVRKIKDRDGALFTLEMELPGKPQYTYYHQVEGEVCFSQLLEFPLYFKMTHPESVESQRTWK